jgi:hypothetical protein
MNDIFQFYTNKTIILLISVNIKIEIKIRHSISNIILINEVRINQKSSYMYNVWRAK